VYVRVTTLQAQATDTSTPAVNWDDARRRVLSSYREWLRAVSIIMITKITNEAYKSTDSCSNRSQGPEIQNMYSLNMPVAALRTKLRQEFERHRYVAQLPTVDVLLFKSHSEYQYEVLTKKPVICFETRGTMR